MNTQPAMRPGDTFNLWFTGCLLLAATFIWLSDSNHSLFILLNQWFSYLPAVGLRHLTSLADVGVMFILLLILLAYRPQLAWQILLCGLITGLIVQAMKYGIGNPRPGAALPAGSFHLHGPLLASSYSFPSGHSATIAVFMSPIIFALQNATARVLLLLLTLLIASARIAVGAHWPLDVIFGVLIAWWVCLLLVPYITRLHWISSTRTQFISLTGLSILVIYAGYFHNSGYDTGIMQAILAGLALLVSWLHLLKTKKKTRHP